MFFALKTRLQSDALVTTEVCLPLQHPTYRAEVEVTGSHWASRVQCSRARLPTRRHKTRVPSPGQEDPLEEGMQPTPVFSPGQSQGQRSLVGHSPWGLPYECIESDMTARLAHPFQGLRGAPGFLCLLFDAAETQPVCHAQLSLWKGSSIFFLPLSSYPPPFPPEEM
ncbi:unnamed protein product [Rangifer tarandus platyrhynchus]|uniref:Uncharacterized protein n=1 Tax=Rangifer tarandus platyrhynchus TaxID=3082113 RepID=A0AC59Z3Y7_RANTA